jgi:hypothetical protein
MSAGEYTTKSNNKQKTPNTAPKSIQKKEPQSRKGGGASDVANLMVPFGLILAKESLESFLKKGYNTTFLNEQTEQTKQTEQNAYTNKMTPKKDTKSKPESGRKVSMSKVTSDQKKSPNKTKTKTKTARNPKSNDKENILMKGGSKHVCDCQKEQSGFKL